MAATCVLCRTELVEGNVGHVYGTNTDEGMRHLSTHHRVAERLEKFLALDTTKEKLCSGAGMDDKLVLCCFCHEELLHNPILLPGVETTLAKAFASKDRAERLMVFAEIIRIGAEAYKEHGQA